MINGNKKVKWGILGTANIARKSLIPALHESEIAEPYAIASRKLKKAEKFADQNSIPKAYGNYEDLLADPEVKIVYNPLPNSIHHKWTIQAAEAGKHILCEKPLAPSVKEAEEMFEICQSREVLLMEAFMYRFHPQTKRVKDLLEEGTIGNPKLVRGSFSFSLVSLNRPKDIRWQREMGGGCLMDLGCYSVNTARYIFESEPNKVYASSLYHPDHDAKAQLQGILEFSDNKTAIIDCSFLFPWQSEYEVVGENGRMRALDTYNPSKGKDVKIEIIKGKDAQVETIPATNEYRLEVDHFTKAVSEGNSPAVSKGDSLGNMRTLEALHRSAEAGEPVEIV